MKLYDTLIRDLEMQLSEQTAVSYPYDPGRAWTDNGNAELVMLRDAAFELGGSGAPSVNGTCVTTTPGIVPDDEIVVLGADLPQIRSDVPFTRLVLLEVEDLGEDEEAYNAIRNLEFVRYSVYPRGYMTRVSAESNAEQVRVSRQAVSSGITFEQVGDLYLNKYKAVPSVKHAKVIFAVDPPHMDALKADVEQIDAITKTLTHILDGIPTDCASCQLKPVCDSVEGLREMHMKQRKNAK